MPTSKGTEVSLSYVQCFFYLASSSLNVSIFHVTCWIPSGQTSYKITLLFVYLFTIMVHENC